MDANFIEPMLLMDRLDSHYYETRFKYVEKKIISSGYLVKELGAICEKVQCGPFGSSVLAENYDSEGVVMVRPVNLKEVLLSDDDLVRFPKKALPSNFPKFKMGDVLFARVGIPSCAIVTREIGTVTISPNIIAARLKDNVDKHYMATFLNTEYGKRQIERRFKAVSQPTVSTDDIRTLKVIIPRSQIQQYIGNKVRKAEKLREEARQLRQEAKNSFEEYVGVLNSKRRMIRNIDVKVLDNDTWAPEFFDSLQITDGSNLAFVTLNNVQRSIKCGEPVKKDDRLGQSYPFYGASGISDTIGSYNFDGQYLIIAQDGSIGCVSVADGRFWANNHVWIVETNEGWNPYFLRLYLNRYPYWYCLTTGSVVPKVTSENLRKLLIPVIPIEIQNKIGNRLANAEERQSLEGKLIQEAKKDVEDLIEGKFDESKISEGM